MMGCIWRCCSCPTIAAHHHAALRALRDLSNHNNDEGRPFIEGQAELLGGGRIPVGHANVNDPPLYRFFRYLEAITASPIAVGHKPNPRDLLVQRN
ncbi:hypothetical protein [Synechococcus sp. CCY9202]|uniref:hypothetical protein n=1 Tax=Synechococcus sp. CCY9202 TaxID=174698 RepID=UPI002B21ACE6|nr:hypothetical protein [Synechococcus sp. CCY9202]